MKIIGISMSEVVTYGPAGWWLLEKTEKKTRVSLTD